MNKYTLFDYLIPSKFSLKRNDAKSEKDLMLVAFRRLDIIYVISMKSSFLQLR